MNKRLEKYGTETFSKDLVFMVTTVTYVEGEDVNNDTIHNTASLSGFDVIYP